MWSLGRLERGGYRIIKKEGKALGNLKRRCRLLFSFTS